MDDARLEGLHHVSLSVQHFADNRRSCQCAAIDERGERIEHLYRRGEHITLSDGGDVSITRGPVFAYIKPFPVPVGDEPSQFARQLDAGGLVIAQPGGVLVDEVNAQPAILHAALFVAAAESIEIYVTGLRDAGDEIHIAVPVTLPTHHLARLAWVIWEIAVDDFDFPRVEDTLLRGDNPFLQRAGSDHQFEH